MKSYNEITSMVEGFYAQGFDPSTTLKLEKFIKGSDGFTGVPNTDDPEAIGLKVKNNSGLPGISAADMKKLGAMKFIDEIKFTKNFALVYIK